MDNWFFRAFISNISENRVVLFLLVFPLLSLRCSLLSSFHSDEIAIREKCLNVLIHFHKLRHVVGHGTWQSRGACRDSSYLLARDDLVGFTMSNKQETTRLHMILRNCLNIFERLHGSAAFCSQPNSKRTKSDIGQETKSRIWKSLSALSRHRHVTLLR